MRKLVETVLENLSSKDVFLFRVTCGVCGSGYGNRPIRFSKANETPVTQSRKIIFDALYEQEFMATRQIAIRNAAEHMNHCPICKRLVCNDCFLICDDLDMCRQCADDLGLQGRPVGNDFAEAIMQETSSTHWLRSRRSIGCDGSNRRNENVFF